MVLGTSGANLWGNLLKGKGTIQANNKSRSGFSLLPHPLHTFEIQKYHQDKLIFDGVYSRNIWPKTKFGACLTNHDPQNP